MEYIIKTTLQLILLPANRVVSAEIAKIIATDISLLFSRVDIILSESTRKSFSIVEYCKDFKQWVILCDKGNNEWTFEDATVVCRQAGRLGKFQM